MGIFHAFAVLSLLFLLVLVRRCCRVISGHHASSLALNFVLKQNKFKTWRDRLTKKKKKEMEKKQETRLLVENYEN